MFTITRSAWVSVALLALSAASFAQSNTTSREIDYDIESQPLVDALNAWARQSRLQLIWPAGSERSQATAKAIEGRYPPHEALQRLLDGSGLTFAVVDAQTVAIQVAPPQQQVARQTARDAAANESRRTARQASRNTTENISEVVVTGTHIRGTTFASAPLIEIDQDDIRRSGVVSAHLLIEQLPQSFGGVREEASSGNSPVASGLDGVTFSSSVNLRGLGSDSTLVLLNGRRLAPTGPDGGYVDVTAIPFAALERVEVLTDGASAIYGSDAVGGVVNFILRDDFDGAETSVHYGAVTDGDLNQLRVSQIFGLQWSTGNALLSYEYGDRDRLRSDERHFAADSDLTRYGGDNFSVPESNPGTISRGTRNFAIPSGQDGTSLSPEDLLPGANLENIRAGKDLLPTLEQHSAFVSLAQELGPAELFLIGRYTKREFDFRYGESRRSLSVPASNPFYVNPFGDPANVNVRYSFGPDLGTRIKTGDFENYGAMLGASFELADSWRGEVYGSHDASNEFSHTTEWLNDIALAAALADPNPVTALNVFGDGSHTNPQTLAAIGSGYLRYTGHSTIDVLHAKADGNLFRLGGSEAKMAVGVVGQRNRLEFETVLFTGGPVQASEPSHDTERDVFGAFAEIYLPFITESTGKVGVRELVATLSARYDHYSDFGSTTNPKASIVWKPIEALALRGTIGTSFKAPLLSQLVAFKSVGSAPLPDVNGTTNVLFIMGTKPNLKPEEATIWTFGLAIPPEYLAGFGLSLDYFNIELDDRIQLPVINAFPLLVDPIYASLITRNPSLVAVQAEYATPGFVPTVPAEQIGAIADVRIANVARTRLDGIDLRATYQHGVALGDLQLSINASYVLSDKVAVTPSAPLTEVVDTLGYPIDLRVRAMGTWSLAGFSTTLGLNYADSYTDTLSNPDRAIDSWTTVDLQFAYELDSHDRWLNGTRIALDVRNVLDEDPPFANMRGTGFDAYNTTALGRYGSLQLTKRW